MVSPPLVRYLLSRTHHRVLVGALDTSRVAPLLEGVPRGRALRLDVADLAAVEPLVREADVVVSLLPAVLNGPIAGLAVARRIPLVNTSYVSPELRALDGAARAAGVLLLSECGLDPGLDHMAAVRAVGRARALGAAPVAFQSGCGGLPAPESNNNPWGYKFSWFPRAVMLATRQPARYLREGRPVELPPGGALAQAWPYPVEGPGLLELYPNRDALAYRQAYGLEEARGLFRGTLRYPGWCATMRAAADLGLLDESELDWPAGSTWAGLLARRLAPGSGSLVERVAGFLRLETDDEVIARLEWAGLLSDREIPARRASPLDLFVDRLAGMTAYRPGERDMVVLEHRLGVTFADGHEEDLVETLVALGEPGGDTAMSRTVSLPAAIATRLILSGGIDAPGVQIPVLPELWRPILDELEEMGIALVPRRQPRFPGPLA